VLNYQQAILFLTLRETVAQKWAGLRLCKQCDRPMGRHRSWCGINRRAQRVIERMMREIGRDEQ